MHEFITKPYNKNTPLAIIPCAGFGKRTGNPNAKELLPHPYFKEETYLSHTINLCKKYGLNELVISRSTKSDLNNYLKEQKINHYLIHQSIDWTDTVLQASKYFNEENILLLPDTYFDPEDIIPLLIDELTISPLTFGTFSTHEPKLWGCLKLIGENYQIAEKPNIHDELKAWGLIAFKKHAGEKLFKLLLESTKDHQFKNLDFCKISQIPLNRFFDLTRG